VRYIAIDIIALWTTNTNVTYSLDGIQGVTQYEPTNRTDYLYDQVLMQRDGLENGQHTLQVNIQRPGVLLVRPLFGGRGEVLNWFLSSV
jgi:hypothetical protein